MSIKKTGRNLHQANYSFESSKDQPKKISQKIKNQALKSLQALKEGHQFLGQKIQSLFKKKEILPPSKKHSVKKTQKNLPKNFSKINKKISGIGLDEKKIKAKLQKIVDLGFEIEDRSGELLNDPQLTKTLKIFSKRVQLLPQNEQEKVNDVLLDLLLSVSAIPTSTHKKGRNKWIQYSIETSSFEQVLDITKSLNKDLKSGSYKRASSLFRNNHYLNHISSNIKKNTYKNLSFEQKSTLFSLSIFHNNVKEELLKNKIFKILFENPNLKEWMIQCSGNLEQNYLNTCAGASTADFALSYAGNILIAAAFSKVSLSFADKNVKEHREKINKRKQFYERRLEKYQNDPTKKKKYKAKLKEIKEQEIFNAYAEKNLKKIDKELAEFEDKINNLAKKTTLSSKEIKNLTLEWSRLTQRLSLNFDPSQVGHPTVKPIKNNWVLSAFLMFIAIFLGIQALRGDRPPKFIMRLQAGFDEDVLYALKDYIKFGESFQLKESDLKILLTKENQKEALIDEKIQDIWNFLLKKNGSALQMSTFGVQHAAFIKAEIVKGKKVFALADPEYEYYRILTPEEFGKFCQDKSLKTLKLIP